MKSNVLKVYREIESLSKKETETLLLLLDKELTQEILLRRDEAHEMPEKLITEKELFEKEWATKSNSIKQLKKI